MYNIQTFNAIAQEGLDTFTANYQIGETPNPDGYVIRSVDLHQQELPASLLAIVRAGAGFNNIPLDRATANGTVVFTTPGSNANAVKELVIGMLIASSRNLFAAAAYSAQNGGADISMRTEKEKTTFNGTELTGKKLAVIGAGHVGSLVANAASLLGMDVVGFDPFLSADAAWRISTDIYRAKTLVEAISGADYVTIHVPKDASTLNLIDASEIAEMKTGATLLNFARDGIVNNQAVIAALDAKELRAYLTDFGEDQLLNRSDVMITPHLGGSTVEAEVNGAIQAANTMMSFLETGNVTNAVNLPTMSVPFVTPNRITIMHENIPNMVGQISTRLATEGINIESMSNAAKANTAYTIIDIASVSDSQRDVIIQQLASIPGVYRVRLLDNPNR
jgi:D-3-phosphoglycerate dehydrogenase